MELIEMSNHDEKNELDLNFKNFLKIIPVQFIFKTLLVAFVALKVIESSIPDIPDLRIA